MFSVSEKSPFLLTLAAFNCLYIPQPILPILAETFESDMQTVSLLITLTMVSLGMAPVFYGVLIEKISVKFVLTVSLIGLILTQFALAASGSMLFMIMVRCVQGLIFPAMFTGLMTYISVRSPQESVQRNIQIYILCTILGGFMGRFFSGITTAVLGWEWYFLISGLMLLLLLPGVLKLPDPTLQKKEKFSFSSAVAAIQNPRNVSVYLIVFTGFFVFAALMNFVPFRIKELHPSATAELFGFIYAGYLGGLISLVVLLKWTKKISSPSKIVVTFIAMFGIAVVGLFTGFYLLLLLDVLLFSLAFFGLHSYLSGYINRLSQTGKATVNGIYVASYYTGGALGSYLPGFILAHSSWNRLVFLLLGVVGMQLLIFGCTRRYFLT